MSKKVFLQAIMIDDLLSSGKHIPFLFMEWDNSVAACSSLATRLRAHGYRGFVNIAESRKHQEIVEVNLEVDTFWLSTNCYPDIEIIWIHKDEKNPWNENRGNCSCEMNSSGFSIPQVRCELNDAMNIGDTFYKVLLFTNQHYHNIS